MVLITGGTGFLGAELIHQLLEKGKKVRALKRANAVIPNQLLPYQQQIEWANADINNLADLADAFEGITQVYHCAALVSFDPASKKKLFRVNIEGTANVANLCAENNIRLLHVSSVAALGDAKPGQKITEKDKWQSDTKSHGYAISKYEGEMEIWRAIAEGLDAVIVNPSVIIGKNAGFTGSGAIFKLVKNGLKFYTNGATGLVDVEDVAKAMILLMDSGIKNERFILSAEDLHFRDFFGQIAQGFGVKAPGVEAKAWMLSLAWRAAKLASWFTGKTPALTKDAARSSFYHSYYCNSKIKAALGIEFKPISISIAETCNHLKSLS